MTGPAQDILTVNAGSSSIKIAVFDRTLTQTVSASVSEIAGASRLRIAGEDRPCEAPDHDAAVAVLLAALGELGHGVDSFSAAGHRVVHGGRGFTEPCLVTPDVIARIEEAIPLAPLHNPANLAAIKALARRAPDLPQTASFDTAFHATNPEVARRYAIPEAEDAKGIRRYGFHGISYASLTERLPGLTGEPLPKRLLALHLGNGASLCAILDGRSVATTMGYSPLDGLTMGTRSGGIDGNAVLRLAQDHGIDGAARLLNRESGLLALGGASDMRELHRADTPQARFAIEHFCYWTVRNAGSMIAAMGGTNALVFTGGIGENDAYVRAAVMSGLAFTGLEFDASANAAGDMRLHAPNSRVKAFIVPAAEEAHIAAEAARVLGLAPGST
ncbi:acetate/propionate family kinase [Ostreiculturibacter nitratireducens]|uniref:acetate/propionate family kinase n=1 Tax=Ostreiculturibacter nitratireducens TaxID=3075226 RepID=UPI0031B5C0A8